jgi:hypothetical protein
MFFENINYWTIFVSAILSIGLGFLWYSPILFGKLWMKEMDMTPEKIEEYKKNNGTKPMVKNYALSTVFALVTAFVIAGLLNSLIITSFSGLFLLAFLLWLAFTLPVAASEVMYGKGTLVICAISSGYYLLCTILTSFVIGIWG